MTQPLAKLILTATKYDISIFEEADEQMYMLHTRSTYYGNISVWYVTFLVKKTLFNP